MQLSTNLVFHCWRQLERFVYFNSNPFVTRNLWEQGLVIILSCSKEDYLLTLLEIVRFFAWSHCPWYTLHEIALKLRSCLYMCMSITRKGEVLLQKDLTDSLGIRIGDDDVLS